MAFPIAVTNSQMRSKISIVNHTERGKAGKDRSRAGRVWPAELAAASRGKAERATGTPAAIAGAGENARNMALRKKFSAMPGAVKRSSTGVVALAALLHSE